MSIISVNAETETVIFWVRYACTKRKSGEVNHAGFGWEKKRKSQTMYVLDGWGKGCNQAFSARALGRSAEWGCLKKSDHEGYQKSNTT